MPVQKTDPISGAVISVPTNEELLEWQKKKDIFSGNGGGGGMGLSMSAPNESNDSITAFRDMFKKSTDSNVNVIWIPGGKYKVSDTIVVPRNTKLIFAPNAELIPLTNKHVFQLKPLSSVEGVTVNLKSMPSFNKACFYFDATDIFQFYEQSHVLKDINIMGAPKTSGWTGTGILMEATKPMTYIDNVKCNNITMTNIGKGIHLRVDPTITKDEDMAWVNANQFHQVSIMNFDYGIYLEGHNSIPRDVGGNLFSQLQLQAEVGSRRMIYCESALNHFDGFFWDLHKMEDTNPAFEFTKTSKFNEVKSAMAAELTESWVDEGYLNSFPSPNNYVADKRVNAFPVSIPYTPNFLGNQDDWMVNGDKRGFTISQVSTYPIKSGELTDLFSFDTESGVTFDMTPVTYDSPVIIEVDLGSDPCWYASFLTVVSPWGGQPQGFELDMFDSLSNKWVGGVHWTKNNKSQTHAVSAPWAGADKCTKVRIKFWGTNKADNTATISRVMMTSSKDGGRAYMPLTATPTIPQPDITPLLPGDKNMVGDIDDVLLLANRKYTVSLLGKPRSNGSIEGMFSLRREQACRFLDPTQENPIIIEIDFGTKPIQFMESVGISFGGTPQQSQTPTNVKIERVQALNGAWQQVTNQGSLRTSSIHVASKVTNVYKLKFTLWGSNDPTVNKEVRVNRIFATVGDGYGTTYVNTESDSVMYGNLEFDTSKGVVLRSGEGSKWRITVDSTGSLSSVKI